MLNLFFSLSLSFMRPVGRLNFKKISFHLELAVLITLGTVSVPSLGHVHHLEEMLSPSSEKRNEIEPKFHIILS